MGNRPFPKRGELMQKTPGLREGCASAAITFLRRPIPRDAAAALPFTKTFVIGGGGTFRSGIGVMLRYGDRRTSAPALNANWGPRDHVDTDL